MIRIITEDRRTCKKNISYSTRVSSRTTANSCSIDRIKSSWLPPLQFQNANKQKVMWLEAAIKECGLVANEVHVLKALVFLTDASNGNGDPSIGSIQERCVQMKYTSSIHYDTVRQCLKRLQQKGAIIFQFRGTKRTNFFTLVGFEYKLESCYRDTLNNINSSSLLKRERGGSKIKNNKKSPSLTILNDDSQEIDQRASPEVAIKAMEKINRILKPELYS